MDGDQIPQAPLALLTSPGFNLVAGVATLPDLAWAGRIIRNAQAMVAVTAMDPNQIVQMYEYETTPQFNNVPGVVTLPEFTSADRIGLLKFAQTMISITAQDYGQLRQVTNDFLT